ncbi:hypothetical protein HS088_TW04G00959 [Tripterygium wilfordii]|uniref:60S ribosomal protein L34 n=1 Tax=Tripterygium wilfordii TaxID=458696 RepID=A0A7J7DRJ2_TRIWF|nr:uncharacterized protein LOC119997837 [Tripterygium wilfordii]KAF5748998.1 hypothetical protein HS088_TW04G00959 [Tripterygium wilfordii]
MDTLNGFSTTTRFGSVGMSRVSGFVYQQMSLFASSVRVSVYALFFALFGLINKIMYRFQGDGGSGKTDSSRLEMDSKIAEQEAETEEAKQEILERENTKESDEFQENETPNFVFKFQFPSYEEFCRKINTGNGDSVVSDLVSEKHMEEEHEVVSGTVMEPSTDSNIDSLGDVEITGNNGFLSDKEFVQKQESEEAIRDDIKENSENTEESLTEKPEEATMVQNESLSLPGQDDATSVDEKCSSDEFISETNQFLLEKDFISYDFDSDSLTSSHDFTSQFIGSSSDGFLSDTDFEEAFELDEFRGEDRDVMEELNMLEQESCIEDKAKGSVDDSKESYSQKSSACDSENSKESDSQKSSAYDSEDSNDLETLWEHQDLIEQLKMELKKVRATGLPTILEESETSPKIMEDLKPWKIDEKNNPEDTMSELHKFYKSYRERMRKYDILNYQKMYALGLLQSKDPLQAMSSEKPSAPAMKSLLSQNFKICKPKKSDIDPTMTFIKELHGDLEVVYVGQLCLSWEILHWQYEKALELWESDRHGLRQYNEVAGEFQQFQVLMQRFIENEPFEGPRIQNYVKKRCVFRNLLQVPVIREDTKDKKRRNGKDSDAITGDMLVEIMEETIRIFWRFVRADKDAHTVIHKPRKGSNLVEPQDPAELELLYEVRRSLQKKEKKLKEILRSGNCILRRFQKQEEDSSDHVLYFFSQVDMKLVSRVLNMSKITPDQLLWCCSKLNKISFVSRKMHVEPSFLLFPV